MAGRRVAGSPEPKGWRSSAPWPRTTQEARAPCCACRRRSCRRVWTLDQRPSVQDIIGHPLRTYDDWASENID